MSGCCVLFFVVSRICSLSWTSIDFDRLFLFLLQPDLWQILKRMERTPLLIAFPLQPILAKASSTSSQIIVISSR
ncbi:hypothetical protein BKA64DRAFT_442361 [Cadophora sp. MPI-SDFR-AT-0126]|nr:hypothetical protein BKA64DRAFT_442361 [Leotiomycetes sp. MPI-SDFR-AT-0126]